MNRYYGISSLELEECSLSRVRRLGAYYTPDKIASAIASWVMRTGEESILEPSAGAGALLSAAYQKATIISPNSACHITAFDIDEIAIAYLRNIMIEGLIVHHADFLTVDPKNYEQVDVVIANPPFTRNHEIPPEIRDGYRRRFGVKGPVGLWVYFIHHSLNFLKHGGRIAFIVPKSVIFTHHGKELLEHLSLNFENVGLYELSSKPNWSHYAEESGAVILADGYRNGICLFIEKGVLEDNGKTTIVPWNNSAAYSMILEKSTELGEFASLSIGAVTGRNEVFLLTEEEKKSAGIRNLDVRPVVSRRRQISGITLTIKDVEKMAREGHKAWLLAPDKLTKNIEKYLEVIPKADIEDVVWFKKRSPWWKVQLASSYDAVFTYMNDLGPRLVRLDPNIVCTNTLHRVHFKPSASADERIAAILSPISTFGQLAAEKIGRAYSGGVLKFELAEAKKIPIVKSEAFNEELVNRVDELLRRKDIATATAVVDEAFMTDFFGTSWRVAQEKLDEELVAIRQARRKIAKGSTNANGN